jgi:hypothetical protein
MFTEFMETFDKALGDARIHAVPWTPDTIFIQFWLVGSPDDQLITVRFEGVTGLRIDTDFADFTDYPMLWDGTFQATDHGTCKVMLDCAGTPTGYLSFECLEFMRVEGRALRDTGLL